MVETRSLKKTTQLGNNKEDQNPTKFYSRFIFKALILAVFCAVVPAFLSQTPELANQTRLLELLHLVFVGIAVSYGLFSRRNYDGGGGGGSRSNDHKADHNNNNNNNNTSHHSYVPKILEVSSVFNLDREIESDPSDDSSGDHHREFQTWRNKYHMKTPEVVISKDQENRFVDRVSSGNREKPLLLPVRSLNYSPVSVSGENSDRWEKVRSKRELLKSLADEKSDVLPSPIPWRSRSSSSSSMEIESQPSIKNPSTVELQPLIKTRANLTPSSSFSSPRKSPPLPNLASESKAQSHGEFQQSPPTPPPPPPPPQPAFNTSPLKKEHPGVYRIERRESALKFEGGGEFHPPPPPPQPAFNTSPSKKEQPGINRIERRESALKLEGGGEFHPPPPPPPPPPLPAFYNSASRKDQTRIERRVSANKTKFAGSEFHPPPPPPPPPPAEYYKSPPTKNRVSSERRKSSEQKTKFDDRSAKRNSPKKVWWSDPIVESNDSRSFLGSKAAEDTEDEEHRRRDDEVHGDDEIDKNKKKEIEEEEDGVCGNNSGSDVDKKADEFIAKFREQIRLQRIESIKRSANNKITTNSSR